MRENHFPCPVDIDPGHVKTPFVTSFKINPTATQNIFFIHFLSVHGELKFSLSFLLVENFSIYQILLLFQRGTISENIV
ncbi:hypothetical protein DYBT9275_01733 [Dyadobacter sp. CECT 9275]|uniref:Uncharacterized protein n=1 Tax=Dyadobacter helix TaxID=2822344 RepID=A0A916J9J0_9BACT|nr:hypothetical protein DYBT9275_01733 [Dyadobacter sp. CECT 9275]